MRLRQEAESAATEAATEAAKVAAAEAKVKDLHQRKQVVQEL